MIGDVMVDNMMVDDAIDAIGVIDDVMVDMIMVDNMMMMLYF
jgi:hypothetical protein